MTNMEIGQVVAKDKEIAAGAPVFTGTRIAIKTLFDYLEESSLADSLLGFPAVSSAQATALIEFAAQNALVALAA